MILINYAILAWTEQANSVSLTLILPTPISSGGLGLSSRTIGFIMSSIGILVGITSLWLYPRAKKRWPTARIYKLAFVGYLVSPFVLMGMNIAAKTSGGIGGMVWALISVQVVLTTLTGQCFGKYESDILLPSFIIYSFDSLLTASIFILIPENASPQTVGALNGLAQTIASSMRIFAPFVSSSLFSLSKEKNLLGGTMVFWVNAFVGAVGAWMSWKIAEVPKKVEDDEEE